MNKKMVLNMGIALLPTFLAIGGFYIYTRHICENEIHTEAVSPNKKILAVFFQRTCPHYSTLKTQIAVVNASEANKNYYNGHGNALSIIGQPWDNDLELSWSGNELLIVTAKITGKLESKHESIGIFNKIKITYNLQ